MGLQIIPKEKIVISTGKNYEEINSILGKTFLNHPGNKTSFRINSNNFEIQREIPYNKLSKVIAKGTIIIGSERNYIRIEITAQDGYLKLVAFTWYSLNAILFLYLIYLTIENGFQLFVLIPIILILVGYGLSTVRIQKAMNRVIEEIRAAVK